ncbi:MAG: type III pantothenate kinase [Flavobacteriales bacterium]|nr:type III pantothenate kinase [Flavobacteriales bacterium]
MVDLIIDVGNTRCKVAVFKQNRLVAHEIVDDRVQASVEQICQREQVRAIGLGSVGYLEDAVVVGLGRFSRLVLLSGGSPSPLRSEYTTMGSLGVDRLANAIAAHKLFPGRATLAVDIGTCITYDLTDGGGTYRGGAISPGPELRAKVMHTHSASLPLVGIPDRAPLIGTSTQESLAAGVFHGTVGELSGIIAAHRQQEGDLGVVLTGGGALPYVRALKSGIFADPFLTLRGLHALLLTQLDANSLADGRNSIGGHRPGHE